MVRFLDVRKITDSFQPGLIEAIQEVVASGVFVKGPRVRQFEESYASFTGCGYCVGVGNGLDALRLIFRSWIISGSLKEGDEVIVPANTYIASILAIVDSRLSPVLVEPDPRTFNLDGSRIEEKITARTKAIMVVHLYGRNAMTSDIKEIAMRHNLKIVEDNAQAAGCMWRGKRTGALGDAAAHSFFPTKNLGALGDGGAVTTDDPQLAENVRTLGNYGSKKKGLNELAGVNSRLDELQAAVLNVKLRRLDKDNAVRREVAGSYLRNIVNPNITLPGLEGSETDEHVWHLFVVRCKTRDDLQRFLLKNEIETLVHYPVAPHHQNALNEMGHLKFPLTEEIHREVLSIPLNQVLDKHEVDRIIEVVNDYRS